MTISELNEKSYYNLKKQLSLHFRSEDSYKVSDEGGHRLDEYYAYILSILCIAIINHAFKSAKGFSLSDVDSGKLLRLVYDDCEKVVIKNVNTGWLKTEPLCAVRFNNGYSKQDILSSIIVLSESYKDDLDQMDMRAFNDNTSNISSEFAFLKHLYAINILEENGSISIDWKFDSETDWSNADDFINWVILEYNALLNGYKNF